MNVLLNRVNILLDSIAVALVVFLLCYNATFKRKRQFDSLTFQSLVIFVAAVAETVVYVLRLVSPWNGLMQDVAEIIYNLLYCFTYVTYLKLILENCGFIKPFGSKKINAAILAAFPIAIVLSWLIDGCPALLYPGMENLEDTIIFITETEQRLAEMLFLFSIVMLFIAWKKHAKMLFDILRASAITVGVGLLTWELECLFVPKEWASHGIVFAVSYSFFFMLVNVELMREVTDRGAAINADLAMAKSIQLDELPADIPTFPSHKDINLAAISKTARAVGGDFYNYFEPDMEHVAIVVGDATGKGIPAALLMMNVQNTISAIAENTLDTAEIAERACDIVSENCKEDMCAAAWIGILDTNTHVLRYTNAGNHFPVILHSDGSYNILDGMDGEPIGVIRKKSYTSSTFDVQKGDRLFLYTFGLTESCDLRGEQYGEVRLFEVLNDTRNLPCRAAVDAVMENAMHFIKGTMQVDDITVMMVDFNFEKEAEKTDYTFDFLEEL